MSIKNALLLAIFSIVASVSLNAQTVTVTAPDGGENLTAGNVFNINWTNGGGFTNNVDIDLSVDGGATFPFSVAQTISTVPQTFAWTVTTAPSTNCRIRVRESGGSVQDVSNANFTIDTPTPTIVVMAPNGGEVLTAGANFTINWLNGGGFSSNVNILLSTDSGATFPTTVVANTANTGSFSWTVSAVSSLNCRIRVEDFFAAGATDDSNANFTINPAVGTIAVTAPNGGESLFEGNSFTITWTNGGGFTGNVDIVLSTNSGGTFPINVTTNIANTGSFNWNVSNLGATTATCRIRVQANAGGTPQDDSDADFTINNVTVAVTAPNGGEVLTIAANTNVTWTTGSFTGNVDIDLSTDSGASFPVGVAANIANTGTFNWTIPNNPSTTCRIRVRATLTGTLTDNSDADFTIQVAASPTITVSAPNGGEVLTVAASTNITWVNGGGFTGNVDIDLSINGGTSYTINVATNIANTGTFNWTIPNNPSTTCRIRVQANAGGTPTDESNANFTIQVAASPTVTVTAPNGGEVLTVAGNTNITWTNGGGFTGNVDIDLSTNGGTSFTIVVAANIANTGTFSWTVPNNPSTTCRIRVQANAGGTPTDSSNANFTIQVAASPTVTVTAPNGGENLTVGNMTNITWTNGGGFTGNVTIDLSLNGGGSFTVNVATNIANSGTFSWTIPNNPATTCRIRVQAAAGGTPTDSSNSNFTIAVATPSTLTVSSPNGGETRVINSGALITWANGGGFSGNVDILLSTDGGASFPTTVANNVSNISFFNWTVPNLPTATARIRVRASGSGNPVDDSNANFSIIAGTLGGAVGDAGGTSSSRQVTPGSSADGLHFYVANDGQSPGPLTITQVRVAIATNDNASNVAITHLAGVRLQRSNGSNLETVVNGGAGWSVAGTTVTVTFGSVTPLSENSPVGGSVDFYVELFFTNVTVIGTPSPAFACSIDNTAGTAINGGGTSNYPGTVAGGSITLASSIPGDSLDDSEDDTTSCTLSENESFLWLALGLLALAVALIRRGRPVEGR